jgi:predicted SAM-dependent methyltransferase
MLKKSKGIGHFLGQCLGRGLLKKPAQPSISQTPSKTGQYLLESRIASGEPIKLELGAGDKKDIPGWLTTDQYPGADFVMDLLKPFPVPDNTVSMIYSSHVLEHFYTDQMEFVLSECRRILKPDGVISVCVPDSRIYLAAYLNPGSFDAEKYCTYKLGYRFYSRIDYLNYQAYMGGNHRHMFDLDNLLAILEGNGFRNVRERAFDPELDRAARDYESIYAEAEK